MGGLGSHKVLLEARAELLTSAFEENDLSRFVLHFGAGDGWELLGK